MAYHQAPIIFSINKDVFLEIEKLNK